MADEVPGRRIVVAACGHRWREHVPVTARVTTPRVCPGDHQQMRAGLVAGASPQLLDLVHVAYVGLPDPEEYWPDGCVPNPGGVSWREWAEVYWLERAAQL